MATGRRCDKSSEQLAVKGFCPVRNIGEPIAQVISSESNVGGVVSKSATVIGLPENAWDSTSYKNGKVPSKQSM